MKKILTLLLISIIINIANAKDAPFKVERMITDFNGVVTNGNNTIAYGDYGIMTYSLDMGQTWKQQNIGDKFKIKKIITVGDDFIGLTNYSLIKSTDNGMTWMINDLSEEPNIINFTSIDNDLYILTKNSILKSDFELNVQSEPVFELEVNSDYSELKSDNKNLYFIKNNRLLQIYNIESNQLSSIDLIDQMDCNSCTSINDIKVSDNMVYVKMVREIQPKGIIPYVLSSSDNGITWQNTRLIISQNAAYRIVNNKINYITPIIPDSLPYSSYSINGFFRVDSIDIPLDTNYIIRINTDEQLERRTKVIDFTDFTIFGDNIISVGKNKLISVSNNGGKTFEFKSNLSNSYNSEYQVNILSDSLIYFINSYEFYKSTNGGITWLPPIFTDFFNNAWVQVPYYYYLDTNGKGFANYRVISTTSDSNAIVTYDGGENFIKTDNPKFELTHWDNNYIDRKGIDLGDKFMFMRIPLPYSTEKKSYTFFRYDKSLNLLDSIYLDVSNIVNLIKTDDNHLFALSLEETGENKADESGNTEDYEYEYKLIQSTDQGATWNTIYNSIPISRLLHKFPGRDYYQYGEVIMKKSLQYNNYILYPTRYNKIYRYDIEKNEFDSIYFPGSYGSGNDDFPLFKYEDRLISISNYEKQLIYIAEFDEFGNVDWDSLAAKEIFEDWDQYDYSPLSNNEIRDVLFLAKMTSNTTGYLIAGQTIGDKFKANLVKISKDITTDIKVEESNIENERAYLWNSLPYPIPGKSVINSRIYWNGTYSLSNLQLKVYNINGEELINPRINISTYNSYSGLLEWECNDVSSGVYVIQVLLNGESINIPVVISK